MLLVRSSLLLTSAAGNVDVLQPSFETAGYGNFQVPASSSFHDQEAQIYTPILVRRGPPQRPGKLFGVHDVPFLSLENKRFGIHQTLFKLSAYKMGVSMRLFKLKVLGLSKLPFSISGKIGA